MVSMKLLASAVLAASALAQNTTLRYMPFGDSITEIVCWRALLWEKLQATEWATVDFVGSGKTENNCKDAKYDRDNEGHSGFLAINIADRKQLVGWLEKNPADVITMHLGTNDIGQQSKPTAQILQAFTTLVGQMRASNPKMKIVVSEARFEGKQASEVSWRKTDRFVTSLL
jgi:lysophospholipase L1-like esterase